MKHRLFFATDLHGSTRCFKKFLSAAKLYRVNTLLLGGDYCSKELILFYRESGGIVTRGNHDSQRRFETSRGFELFRQRMEVFGSLFHETTAEACSTLNTAAYVSIFNHEMEKRLAEWVEIARARLADDIRIFVIPGNDDDPCLDPVFASPPFEWAHRLHRGLWGNWSILGWGGSNPTPWSTVREFPEEEIARQLEAQVDTAYDPTTSILFVHPPPWKSGLDSAPAIDTNFKPKLGIGASQTIPVGSRAVRNIIHRWRPALGLFGHVHESAGQVRVGSTLCVNPGSQYYAGRLAGAIIDLEDNGVPRVLLTEG